MTLFYWSNKMLLCDLLKPTFRHLKAVSLVLLLLWLLPITPAAATTLNLVPTADTRISPGENQNWNHLFSMAVYTEPGNVQRPLLQFDLSAIPSGAHIKSATLRLTERDTFLTSQGRPTYAFRVTRPWSETQATGLRATAATPWTNSGGDFVGRSGIQDVDPYSIAYDTGTAPLLFMDLTPLVKDWVENGLPNHGLLLRAPQGNHLHFHTREAGLPNSPLLTIEYEPREINIVSAFLRSSQEVEVLLDRQYGTSPASVSVEITADGIPYRLRNPVELPSSDGPEPFIFNLATSAQTPVPKFTKNMRLTIRATATLESGETLDDSRSMLVLLPVILVPGLNNGSGGFTYLEGIRDAVRQASQQLLDADQLLGEPYRTLDDSSGYPTLFALEYGTNNDSFVVGSQKLQSLVGFALSRTYTARVNLVGYSKGALVARQFLVSGDNARTIHQFIMCAPPNTGSVAAYFQDFVPLGGDPTNLLPTWPWLKPNPRAGDYRATPNRELTALNRVQMPAAAGVQYTLFYSDTGSIEHIPVVGWLNNGLSVINWGNFPFRPPVPLIDQRGPGDGIVPRFSALGYERNLNDERDPDGLFPDELIPAFRGVPIYREPVAGFHAGYMNQPGMISRLPRKLLEDVEP